MRKKSYVRAELEYEDIPEKVLGTTSEQAVTRGTSSHDQETCDS